MTCLQKNISQLAELALALMRRKLLAFTWAIKIKPAWLLLVIATPRDQTPKSRGAFLNITVTVILMTGITDSANHIA